MKTVGIIPLYDEKRDSYWLIPGYMKMLEEQSIVPMMLPLTEDKKILGAFMDICGGFLLTGGQDVSPQLYGKEKTEYCGKPCILRDMMESYILDEAIKRNKSVLGICRGIQFMNAYLGGTLFQDLPSEFETKISHSMEPPYDRMVHYVDIRPKSILHGILKQDKIGVNSYHHQAIKMLSPKLNISAVSEDGIIEAVYMPDKNFIVGLQWHPELSYRNDNNSRLIIKAFADSIKEADFL